MGLKQTLFCLLAYSSLLTHAQVEYTGVVLDSLNSAPLPYASVRLKGTDKGTSTNATGEFILVLKNVKPTDSLEFSFIGYKSQYVPVSADRNLTIRLTDIQNTLDVFVVYPLSPADQIRASVRKIPLNYPNKQYNTYAYYRQALKEQAQYIDYAEAVFLSEHTCNEKRESHHQLALYRKPFDLVELNVMSRRAEKQRTKFLKKNPEKIDSIPSSITEGIRSMLNPEILFTYDVVSNDLLYLDTTRLHDFYFEYGKETVLNGRDLLTIDFKSKGSLENVRRSGTIYIDIETDAIVSIKETGAVVLPVWVQPLLLIAGIGIKRPRYTAELRYRQKQGQWYPEFIYWNLNVHLVDKHLFKKNEKADFYGEQLLHVQQVELDSLRTIPKENRFVVRKPINDQVHTISGLDWNQIDVIR